ncbi:MAG: TerB family tellurite resistance protein [Rhodospirillaceae bacterium]|nr:TerB family tellurite resistance protein [Rhodospirillaceae bacterium]
MLNKIKSMLRSPSPTEAKSAHSLELAASALLVEAAIMDGTFDEAELKVITTLLCERFSLNASDAAELIEDAKKVVEGSIEIYGFARTIKDSLDNGERVKIIEMLWRVVLADGHVDDYESNLIRRVSGLIYVSDRESGDARKRVLENM